MKNAKMMIGAFAALVTISTTIATPAMAKHDTRHDRQYRGDGGDYRHKCGGGNGAVGTIAGGAGGALAGNALGGGTLGTIAGGVGGGLLGRHLDKKHTRSRNGC